MWVCKEFGIDPAEYFTETDPARQAARDAAGTVRYDELRLQKIQEHNKI